MVQTQQAIDPFSNPDAYESTDSECVARVKKDRQWVHNISVKKKIFMETLAEEGVAEKISTGKISMQEVHDFFQGFEVVLSHGNEEETVKLRAFLSSGTFRVRGNSYLLKYLRDKNFQDTDKRIAKEILMAIRSYE